MTGDSGLRPVILHAHLFKNAGSTLDWSLERAFADSFCDHRDDAAMRGDPGYLSQFLTANPQIRALSSHWLPVPWTLPEGLRPFPVILFRDPIERMWSVYAFERRQALEHPGTRMARECSFRDYVRWRLEPGTGPVLRNYHTRMCSGDYRAEPDAATLARARENLSAFAVVGLVERYAEFVVLLESTLRNAYPDIDLAYRSQNVSDAADLATPAERRARAEDALGPLLEQALEANQLDLLLYQWAREHFENALHGVGQINDRLSVLSERCAMLGSA